MKVLLLGAGGQLGQHLGAYFPGLVALNRSQLDLSDLSGALQAYAPEVVINAAAYTAVDRAEDEPAAALEVNCEGPARLALECRRLGVPLVHFSTDYVFSGQGSEAWSETDICAPVNHYGASKLAGEERLRQNLEQHLIVRVSWLFGAHGQNFVKTILRLAGEREQLRVVSDQRGCPTWCGHLGPVLTRLLESRQWGTYHYCDGPATNWWEFACEIVEQARRLNWPLKVREIVPIASTDYPTRAARPGYSVLDCAKLGHLGMAQSDWRDGLQRTLLQLRPG